MRKGTTYEMQLDHLAAYIVGATRRPGATIAELAPFGERFPDVKIGDVMRFLSKLDGCTCIHRSPRLTILHNTKPCPVH